MARGLRYTPGMSYLVAGRNCIAYTSRRTLAERIWSPLAVDGTVNTVLEIALVGGIASMPDLVVVECTTKGARVVVRGVTRVGMTGRGEKSQITGESVATWVETLNEDIESISVGSHDDDGAFPLIEGISLAGGFQWVLDGLRPTTSEVDDERRMSADSEDKVVAASLNVSSAVVGREPEPSALPTKAPIPSSADQGPLAAGGGPRLADTRTDFTEDFDHLFGSTIYRSVEAAAVRDLADDPVANSGTDLGEGPDLAPHAPGNGPQAPVLGDHDGMTIMAAELADVRARPDGEPAPARSGQQQMSAVLVLPSGQEVPLDAGAVIGRRPQVDRVDGRAIPRLIAIDSPDQDISRSHVEISMSTEGLVAVDLHSMNGTVVIRADGERRSLEPGRPQPLAVGDFLEISEGITLAVREAS